MEPLGSAGELGVDTLLVGTPLDERARPRGVRDRGARSATGGHGHGWSLSGVQESWVSTRFSSAPHSTNERDLADSVTAEREARQVDTVTGGSPVPGRDGCVG